MLHRFATISSISIRRRLLAIVCALGLASTWCSPARAAQILISPGDDWQSRAAKARPGDEIILMPGRHRAASLDRLVGTADAPITIRGASKDKPSIIGASLDGIRIKEAAHVVIRDLQIIGGSASGIWIAADQHPEGSTTIAPAPAALPAPGEPLSATPTLGVKARDILIDNVAISKVGPRGQRHGVYLCGFADVHINDLRVEGWGGSAVELIACEDVVITKCAFKGIKDHSQYCGIRARAGCDRVSISEAKFENAGEIAVCLGGKSNPEEFVPPIASDAANASVFEAARVSIDQSLIRGSQCAIAFIHAVDCVVRSTTIMRPQRCVIALKSQSPDVRIKPTGRNIFGSNLIVWEPGDVKQLVEVDGGVDAGAFVLEHNLWWSGESPEQRAKLGALPGKNPASQEFDLDPKLNQAFRPTTSEAMAYGQSV